jgi:isopentenyldiphosphate isomerase
MVIMSIPTFVPKPGQIDYTHASVAPVLNCVVRHGEKILIVKRNSKMIFHPGVWNGISGFLDEPSKTVREKIEEEIHEELGLQPDAIVAIKEGKVLEQDDREYNKKWIVHPALVDVSTDNIRLDWEAEQFAWIAPHELSNFELLPGYDVVVKSFFPNLAI